jgi:small-conductance mechanosensitive channel
MEIFGLTIDTTWEQWAFSGCIVVAFIALAFLSRFLLELFLKVVAHRTKTNLDDLLVNALKGPIFFALIVGGLWLGLARHPQLADYTDLIQKIATVLFIATVAVAAVRLLSAFLVWYGKEIAPRTKSNLDDKLLPLIRRVGTVIIYVIALLILLDKIGINISPLLAGLGIGGLAVALALQPTLSNFMAGTYIISDAVVHTGDYIKLDGGPEGFVENIGWRVTKLRQWQGNTVVLPNSRLSDAIVTDFEQPDKTVQFAVDCGVSYESDLEKVEKVALEVARQTMQNFPEGDKGFTPALRYGQFGESNINFTVVMKAVDRGGSFYIKHQFIKALHRRFKQEGIEIQYPVRKLQFINEPKTDRK